MPTLEELLQLKEQMSSLPSFKKDTEEDIASDVRAAPIRPEFLNFVEQYKKNAIPRPEGARSFLGTSSPEDRAIRDLNEYDELKSATPGQRSEYDNSRLADLKKVAENSRTPANSFYPTPDGAPVSNDQIKQAALSLASIKDTNEDEDDDDSERKPASVSQEEADSNKDKISALIAAQTAQSRQSAQDMMQRYIEAQKRQSTAELGVGLARAAEQFGSALARAKPSDQTAYEEAMKRAGGISEQALKQEAVRKEAEEQDPTSAVSKQYQDLANIIGIKTTGSESAATLKQAIPFIERFKQAEENRKARIEQAQIQRESIAAQKQIALATQQQRLDEKTEERLNDKITADKQGIRTTFGKNAQIVSAGNRILTLINQSPDKNLTPQQVTEVAIQLDKMLSQGAGSIFTTRKIVPKTAPGDISSIKSYILGRPFGANQVEYVKQLEDTVKREMQVASEQIKATQLDLLSGNEDFFKRHPEKIKKYEKRLGVNLFSSDEDQSASEKKAASQNADKVVVEKDGKQFRLPKSQLQSAISQGYKEVK